MADPSACPCVWHLQCVCVRVLSVGDIATFSFSSLMAAALGGRAYRLTLPEPIKCQVSDDNNNNIKDGYPFWESIYYVLGSSPFPLRGSNIIIPIIQMKKLRLREVKCFAQDRATTEQQGGVGEASITFPLAQILFCNPSPLFQPTELDSSFKCSWKWP